LKGAAISERIAVLCENRSGSLWVAPFNPPPSLVRVDVSSGEIVQTFRHDPEDPRSLGRNRAAVLHEDRAGTLWIGMFESGLYRYYRAKGDFVRYRHDPGDQTTIGDDRIRAIHEDARGVLWIGTRTGLDTYDRKTGRFTHVDGLRKEVNAILEDGNGDLWLNVSRTLFKLSEVVSGRPRLLKIEAPPGPSFGKLIKPHLRTRDGTLHFADVGGVFTIDPTRFQSADPPPVVLTDFRILNQTVPIGRQADTPLTVDIAATREITLSDAENRIISFDFAALDFAAPGRARYAYRLEGFEDDWQETSDIRRATYTTLKPGRYVFRVKASNSHGVWNDMGVSVALTILPPWWATAWFRALALTAAVGLLLGAYKMRIRRIRWKNRLLEKELTERKRADREALLRAVAIESMADGCVIVDAMAEGMPVIFANDRLSEISGYSISEIVGRNCRFLHGLHTSPDTIARMEEAIAQGSSFRGEILNYRKDGTPFWNLLQFSPVRDKGGTLTHFVGIMTDTTEQKEAEEDKRQQRDELAHVSRVAALDGMAAAIAHELNQPLAAIAANARAARRFMAGGEVDLDLLGEILDDIVSDDHRAAEVIRRMRALLKKKEVKPEPIDLNAVVRDVVTLVHSDAIIRRVEIETELDDAIPKAFAGRVEIQQVTLNLILNGFEAMRHTPAEKRKLLIRTASRGGKTVEVSVSDCGEGLEGDGAKLFTPFYTTKPEGMGMGLAINRTIIQAHGGRIWAENRPEGGATLSFELPVKPE
jgi:PAS domain S-box-containing protein